MRAHALFHFYLCKSQGMGISMSDHPVYDIAIVGGGAAGLAAAVFMARESKQRGFSVILLEKAPRVGRKLLATGNGTCNLSNADAHLLHYHGADPSFAEYALKQFPLWMSAHFFLPSAWNAAKGKTGEYTRFASMRERCSTVSGWKFRLSACMNAAARR